MARVVVLDASTTSYRVIKHLLGAAHTVDHYEHALLALEYVREHAPDVVFLNIDQNGCDPLDVIAELNLHLIRSPVVAILERLELERVVAAVQRGACDVIHLPIHGRELQRAVTRALAHRQARASRVMSIGVPELVGMSGAMIRLRREIQRLSAIRVPVVITGESGVGKELVAQALHRLSPSGGGRLETRNCGALPETLIEAELFGTERGAYTDAVHRTGAFGLAHDGSIFLDEIGELSQAAQAALLRVIETGTYNAVGGTRLLRTNARLISATHRDLRAMVQSGAFRDDLYYRVNTFRIHVPALREHREDVPVLVRHFEQLLREEGITSRASGFGADALRVLTEYDWPGNVRELRAVVMRAIVDAQEDVVRSTDLSFY